MRIKSMQTKIEVFAPISKKQRVDLAILKSDVFKDFPRSLNYVDKLIIIKYLLHRTKALDGLKKKLLQRLLCTLH